MLNPENSVKQKRSVSQKQIVSKTNLNRQAKKSIPSTLAIVLAAVLIATLISGVLTERTKRRTEPSKPIPLSTRLSLAKDFISMPDGMEIEKCEVQGLYDLQIIVLGNAETEKRDYLTSSIFTLSLFDEIKCVTFSENETGKMYKFERPEPSE